MSYTSTTGRKRRVNDEDVDLQSEVKSAYENAKDFIESEISHDRKKANDYYYGRPFGDERPNRSQVVLTEVRDTVDRMLPSLVRIFLGGNNVVEFAPTSAEDVDRAAQATEYVNHVLMRDNPGYRIITSAIKDALVRRLGIVKWHWQDDTSITEETYEGISPEVAQMLHLDPEVEILKTSLVLEGKQVGDFPLADIIAQLTGYQMPDFPPLIGEASINMRVRRTRKKGKAVVDVLPPEEFLIERKARTIHDTNYVAHRRRLHVSDLVAMGYDFDEVLDNAGSGLEDMNDEDDSRLLEYSDSWRDDYPTSDPSSRRVWYVEHYIKRDLDGDGVQELHRVCTIGNACHVLHDEVVPEIPFALFESDPEPHEVFGLSVADRVMDLQRIKSSMFRLTLDGFQHSITPRSAIVEGQVNIDDALNTEVGALIRERQSGMIRELRGNFDGQTALGMLSYVDEIKASRTGISRATMGLEAGALQSTTKAAVEMQRASGEDRIEIVARNLAEGGMRDLARGLLRLLVRHQDTPRIIRMRNRNVVMDPRSWSTEMDCVVEIGQIAGSRGEKSAFLMNIMALQEKAQQAVPNLLTDFQRMRNAAEELLAINGFKDVDRYFRPVTEEDMQRIMQGNQQPDPNMELLKLQAEQVRVQTQIALLRHQREMEQMQRKDDLDRDKLDADIALKAAEIQARYGAQVSTAEIKAMIDADRNAMNAMVAAERNAMQMQQPQQPMGGM